MDKGDADGSDVRADGTAVREPDRVRVERDEVEISVTKSAEAQRMIERIRRGDVGGGVVVIPVEALNRAMKRRTKG